MLSRERLLDIVWGVSYPGGTRTWSDMHVAQLRRQAAGARDAIRTVTGRRVHAPLRRREAAIRSLPTHELFAAIGVIVVTVGRRSLCALDLVLTRRAVEDATLKDLAHSGRRCIVGEERELRSRR